MATIKLSNNVNIDNSSLKTYVDYSNMLADVTIAKGKDGSDQSECTISQDGYVLVYTAGGHNAIRINGIYVGRGAEANNGSVSTADSEVLYRYYNVKKGDVITKYSYYGLSNSNDAAVKFRIYGTR